MEARAMTIRDAREADLARIVAIYNEAVPGRRATADTEPVSVQSTLLAFVFGHNEPSVRLFEAHGFTRWGHLPRVATLDGREADLLILGRRLD